MNDLSMTTYIIISAYKAADFIQDCLHAACKNPATVLLGIDGCPETLQKVQAIRYKYDNLRVFYYPQNKGIYLTLNDLIVNHVPESAAIITFDADDIMNDRLVKRMLEEMPCYSKNTGVMCITKQMWNEFGGFMSHRVHMDTDLIRRMQHKYDVKQIEKLFWRRRHPAQLTKAPQTTWGSEIRNKAKQASKENLSLPNPQLYFKPECNVGKEI